MISGDENNLLNALENLANELQAQIHDDIKRIDNLESPLKEQTCKYLGFEIWIHQQ